MTNAPPADVPGQRTVIDRRKVADRLAVIRDGKSLAIEARQILGEALAEGRSDIERRLASEPGNGRAKARRLTAFSMIRLSGLAGISSASGTSAWPR